MERNVRGTATMKNGKVKRNPSWTGRCSYVNDLAGNQVHVRHSVCGPW